MTITYENDPGIMENVNKIVKKSKSMIMYEVKVV